MKSVFFAFSVALATEPTFAQGVVNFDNGGVALISAGQSGQMRLISSPTGSYYFGLFVAQ